MIEAKLDRERSNRDTTLVMDGAFTASLETPVRLSMRVASTALHELHFRAQCDS